MPDLTVKDLIAQLQELDPDLPVLLQKDPEGNGFFWARGVDADAYVPTEDLERDRTDECASLASLQEDADEDEDVTEGRTKVACVFP